MCASSPEDNGNHQHRLAPVETEPSVDTTSDTDQQARDQRYDEQYARMMAAHYASVDRRAREEQIRQLRQVLGDELAQGQAAPKQRMAAGTSSTSTSTEQASGSHQRYPRLRGESTSYSSTAQASGGYQQYPHPYAASTPQASASSAQASCSRAQNVPIDERLPDQWQEYNEDDWNESDED